MPILKSEFKETYSLSLIQPNLKGTKEADLTKEKLLIIKTISGQLFINIDTAKQLGKDIVKFFADYEIEQAKIQKELKVK